MEIGFDVAAAVGMDEGEVATPALVVDLDMFEANLARMQALAADAGMALRPHAKTHKSPDIGRAQVAVGAVGLCCQKVSEAEALVAGGIGDVLVSNQVRQPRALARLAALAHRARVAACVDDAGGVAALAAAVAAAGTEVGVLVELDVGAGRCGCRSADEAAALARAVAAAHGLRFEGLQAYHGGAQHIVDPEARRAVIEAAAARVREAVAALGAAGLECPRVTGAGTGSFPFEAASGVWTELQCGSYVFMDADYGRVRGSGNDGLWGFGHALFVLAGVMSVAPGRAVLDAGLKAMSGESGVPRVAGRPDLVCRGLSDEHAVLDDPAGSLKVGDRVRLIPGHCDPTVNLWDDYVGLRGGRVECLWPVSARGKVW
jgi:3-hydroxy-D-aspartate aldolase